MAAEAVAPPGTGEGNTVCSTQCVQHTAALVPQNLSSSRREQLYEGIDRPTFLTQESLWTGRRAQISTQGIGERPERAALMASVCI